MEERKMSEKEAMELIARSLEAQRRKLSFVRSTLLFGAGALALAVTTADYVVRRTTGRDLTLMLVLAGTVAGLAALYFHYRSHRTVTANDRTLMNVWAYALGVCLYTAGYVAAGDGLQLPVMGLLTMGAAIAAGVTGELFRRSEANRSNQSGSLGGLLFISIAGAFLAAWIFRAAAAGETVSQFILTLAAAVILFFGTGIVLRYNERRNRV